MENLLLHWTLEEVIKSKIFDKIILSTDSIKIKNKAKNLIS